MCGRYSLAADIEGLEDRFDFRATELTYRARFNVAPTQQVLTVTNNGLENQAQLMKWGLIPFWAKDPSIGNRMINARAETVGESRVFRQAFQSRRCLVIADGFYEWMKVGNSKVPMRIILTSGEPFGFAGLWETWKSVDGEPVQSCTIMTTSSNELMEPIHNRMPVILPKGAESIWLDQGQRDKDTLASLLIPYASTEMEVYPVSTLINSPKNDVPDIIARAV
ncbi:MAG: SOS response-associated peptidase [Chloroflexi bacterium]|nr:SOS response-associated peptidase [Chloroflexota bacterium]